MNRLYRPVRPVSRSFSCLAALMVLLVLTWPSAALAAPPRQGYEGPEKCAECHYAESQIWRESSHAHALIAVESEMQLACPGGGDVECTCLECHTTAFEPDQGTYAHGGVTCEACHGVYQEDHPQSGTMVLTIDSTLCQSCHIDTHEQWELGPHGAANVGCTSCHQVHSQELRQEEEALCDSCHRDQHQGPIHAAHIGQDVECVDCHQSASYEPQPLGGVDTQVVAVAERPVAASHTFAVSSTGACLACHIEGVGMRDVAYTEAVSQRASELALELDKMVDENRTLQTLSVVALGVGLGIGAFFGVVLVLAIGFVCRRRAEA